MTNSRQKGKRGEREWARYLAELGFGTYGVDTRRGVQHSGGPDSPDVRCAALPGIHFEVKVGSRAYIGLGRTLDAAMAQAAADAHGRKPVVAWRNDGCREWNLSFAGAEGVLVTTTGAARIKHVLAALQRSEGASA